MFNSLWILSISWGMGWEKAPAFLSFSSSDSFLSNASLRKICYFSQRQELSVSYNQTLCVWGLLIGSCQGRPNSSFSSTFICVHYAIYINHVFQTSEGAEGSWVSPCTTASQHPGSWGQRILSSMSVWARQWELSLKTIKTKAKTQRRLAQ